MHTLGGKAVGMEHPVRIMGIINASPESFHKSSIRESAESVADAAAAMERQGADYIDIGGMSTAPYLDTIIDERTEMRRVRMALQAASQSCSLPISVDTSRAAVAKMALQAGARILNDVTGLLYDPRMGEVVSRYLPDLVLCAYGTKGATGTAQDTADTLSRIVQRASEYGTTPDRMVVDPAIGFFRRSGTGDRYTRIQSSHTRRDISVLADLRTISDVWPTLVSASNKSFIGETLRHTDTRLYGSLAAETIAVMGGASIIRTHNVSASRDAIRMAEACRISRKSNIGCDTTTDYEDPDRRDER